MEYIGMVAAGAVIVAILIFISWVAIAAGDQVGQSTDKKLAITSAVFFILVGLVSLIVYTIHYLVT